MILYTLTFSRGFCFHRLLCVRENIFLMYLSTILKHMKISVNENIVMKYLYSYLIPILVMLRGCFIVSQNLFYRLLSHALYTLLPIAKF